MLLTKKQLDDMLQEHCLIRTEYLECLKGYTLAQEWFDNEAVLDFPDTEAGKPRLARAPEPQLRIPVTRYGADMLYGAQVIPYPDHVDIRLRVWSMLDEYNGPDPMYFVPSVADSGKSLYRHTETPLVSSLEDCATVDPSEVSGDTILMGRLPDISTTWHADAAAICFMWQVNSEWGQLYASLMDRLQCETLIGLFPIPVGATAKRVPSCESLLSWWQTCGLIQDVEPSQPIYLPHATEVFRNYEHPDLRGLRSVFTTDWLSRALTSPDALGPTGPVGPPGLHGVARLRGLPHPMGPPVSSMRERYNALVLEAQQRCAVPARSVGRVVSETRERLQRVTGPRTWSVSS